MVGILFSYGLEGLRRLLVELSMQKGKGGGHGVLYLQAEELLQEPATMVEAPRIPDHPWPLGSSRGLGSNVMRMERKSRELPKSLTRFTQNQALPVRYEVRGVLP